VEVAEVGREPAAAQEVKAQDTTADQKDLKNVSVLDLQPDREEDEEDGDAQQVEVVYRPAGDQAGLQGLQAGVNEGSHVCCRTV